MQSQVAIGYRPDAEYVPLSVAIDRALAGEIPARGWCEGEVCLINICGTKFARVLVPGERSRVLALPRPGKRSDGGVATACE